MANSLKTHAANEVKEGVTQQVLEGFEGPPNPRAVKIRATKQRYISEKQLVIEGFESLI